jgi:threonine dehydrogenase-like Zn-dependent dehydrogenase
MQDGDVLGHEFMGEVVEVGPDVTPQKLAVGDRVVVPFPIACGACAACRAELYSCCENSNPNAGLAEKLFGHPLAGIFGYSHLTGGFAGGQAEYARVPFADVGPLRIESDLSDEQVLFLTDILPTAYMGADMCDIKPSDVVAVWGAGPVGQLALDSARVLGAAQVIAIDRELYRLDMGRQQGCTTINFDDVDVRSALLDITAGRGPDKCIDAVGLESTHGAWHINALRPGQAGHPVRDGPSSRPAGGDHLLPERRRFGHRGVRGVHRQVSDGVLHEPVFDHAHGPVPRPKYMGPLLGRIEGGEINPARIITHTLPLDQAPNGYDIFKHKADGCEKVVLKP